MGFIGESSADFADYADFISAKISVIISVLFFDHSGRLMMTPFPAILIGGPPHSGKSVLVYSLSQALRARGVAHYALRACPDGEGDFSNESDQTLVRLIRQKGAFTEAFVAHVAAYLEERHLPLLVDVGGRPTPEQLAVFARCTHAVLLVADRPDEPGAYERLRAEWGAMLARAGLPIIADLRSTLSEAGRLDEAGPVVRGVIAGLERGRMADGPAFEALVAAVAARFPHTERELAARHRALAPAGARLVDLPALLAELAPGGGRWETGLLPRVAERAPAGEALAIYGRGPNWLYALLALRAAPAPLWLFDVRYGWLRAPELPETAAAAQAGWRVSVEARAGFDLVEMATGAQYLDPEEPEGLPLPVLPPDPARGLVLSGRVPHWLLASAARRWGPGRPWVAVFHPPVGGAVVVAGEVGKVIGV